MTPCELCKGACCESIVIKRGVESEDVWRWVEFHGKIDGESVRLPIPCKHLMNGKCGIYEIRPQCCRDYKVGSEMCLRALSKRENAEEIRKLIAK